MPQNNQTRRLLSLGIVALVLMGTLTVRMWFLQAVKAESDEEIVLSVRTRTIRLYPERGRIFDAKGRVVADNKRVLTATIDREVIRDPEDRLLMFQRLSGPLQISIEGLFKRYEDKRFGPLEALPLKEDISEETAQFLVERSEDYPGIGSGIIPTGQLAATSLAIWAQFWKRILLTTSQLVTTQTNGLVVTE
jgi:penicillin-binding protein 2